MKNAAAASGRRRRPITCTLFGDCTNCRTRPWDNGNPRMMQLLGSGTESCTSSYSASAKAMVKHSRMSPRSRFRLSSGPPDEIGCSIVFFRTSRSSSPQPEYHLNLCWVIPKNAPACKRDVQFTDKLELEDGGYDEF